MGQASRTTKLLLDLDDRAEGGANTAKRAYLEETAKLLDRARAFYVAFFLAHPDKLGERVPYFSDKHQEERERLISPNELLTWAESLTVATTAHPHPLPSYNFSEQFPEFPFIYRRSVIKDALGKARSYLSNLANWNASGAKKGQPGPPSARNHPTLYDEACCLDLDGTDLRPRKHTCFARLKVYTGTEWRWHNYPVKLSRYFEARWRDAAWESQSPKLILRKKSAALHFPQVKKVAAKKVKESKEDPHLVTVAVDLNVKKLAVITVRQDERIIETVFVSDHGLDQARFRHLKRLAKKQWQSGKPVKSEHSNQQLWGHVRRMNEDAAHKVSRSIANVCAKYPGCVLLFERLRKIKPKGASKSRRMNRRQANQLRGKINRYTKDKAYVQGTVTVEVNPHGTSQYCSRCGAKGERFSSQGGKRIQVKWGKLFECSVCHFEVDIAGESLKSLKSTGRGRDAQGRWRNWRNNAQIRGELWRVLRYKCNLAGIRLEWQQPRKTSHTCPHCGKPADTFRSPTEREQKQDWGAWLWCDHCGWNGARDYAAALNIARLGAHFITHYLQTDRFSHASIADTAVKSLSYMGSGAVLRLPPPIPRGRLLYAGRRFINGWKRSVALCSSYPSETMFRLCG